MVNMESTESMESMESMVDMEDMVTSNHKYTSSNKKYFLNSKELEYQIYTDYFRFHGKWEPEIIWKYIFCNNYDYDKSVNFLICNRVYSFLAHKERNIKEKILFRYLRNKLHKLQTLFGIDMSYETEIGIGFVIYHTNGIVIHNKVKIGDNCSIAQQVTIGNNLMGGSNKVPVIGNNVSIWAGAKIFGDVHIGNNVTIGAGAIVNSDVPDDCVVAGNPARIISYKKPVILHKDYCLLEDYD